MSRSEFEQDTKYGAVIVIPCSANRIRVSAGSNGKNDLVIRGVQYTGSLFLVRRKESLTSVRTDGLEEWHRRNFEPTGEPSEDWVIYAYGEEQEYHTDKGREKRVRASVSAHVSRRFGTKPFGDVSEAGYRDVVKTLAAAGREWAKLDVAERALADAEGYEAEIEFASADRDEKEAFATFKLAEKKRKDAGYRLEEAKMARAAIDLDERR